MASQPSRASSLPTEQTASVTAMGQLLSILPKVPGSEIQSDTSQLFDKATLDSLYRLARLLTATESDASELVRITCRKAPQPDRGNNHDVQNLRRAPFERLWSVFRHKFDSKVETSSSCGLSQNGASPISVRELILRQDPTLRAMIFLRHCEGLSVEDVAAVTHESPKAAVSRLLAFRQLLATSVPMWADNSGRTREAS